MQARMALGGGGPSSHPTRMTVMSPRLDCTPKSTVISKPEGEGKMKTELLTLKTKN